MLLWLSGLSLMLCMCYPNSFFKRGSAKLLMNTLEVICTLQLNCNDGYWHTFSGQRLTVLRSYISTKLCCTNIRWLVSIKSYQTESAEFYSESYIKAQIWHTQSLIVFKKIYWVSVRLQYWCWFLLDLIHALVSSVQVMLKPQSFRVHCHSNLTPFLNQGCLKWSHSWPTEDKHIFTFTFTFL